MKTKKVLVVFILGLCINSGMKGQTSKYQYAGAVSLIRNEYLGDLGDGIWNSANQKYLGASVSASAYVNSLLNLTLDASYGDYGYRVNPVERFLIRKFDIALLADLKPFDLYSDYSRQPLSPIISVGIGIAAYDENFKRMENRYTSNPTTADILRGIDLILPVGAGLKYQLNDYFAIQYKYLFHITNRDIRDENMGAGNPLYQQKWGNDAFGKHLFSFIFVIGDMSHPWLRY